MQSLIIAVDQLRMYWSVVEMSANNKLTRSSSLERGRPCTVLGFRTVSGLYAHLFSVLLLEMGSYHVSFRQELGEVLEQIRLVLEQDSNFVKHLSGLSDCRTLYLLYSVKIRSQL